jgi:hypothetical protein
MANRASWTEQMAPGWTVGRMSTVTLRTPESVRDGTHNPVARWIIGQRAR